MHLTSGDSACIYPKKGRRLDEDEVIGMFGDDKDVLITLPDDTKDGSIKS